MRDDLERAQREGKDIEALLEKERESLAASNEELRQLESTAKKATKRRNELSFRVKELTMIIERGQREVDSARKSCTAMEARYNWIREAKPLFGKKGTPFFFEGQNLKDSKKKLQQLEELKHRLQKNLNAAVMSTIDKYAVSLRAFSSGPVWRRWRILPANDSPPF